MNRRAVAGLGRAGAPGSRAPGWRGGAALGGLATADQQPWAVGPEEEAGGMGGSSLQSLGERGCHRETALRGQWWFEGEMVGLFRAYVSAVSVQKSSSEWGRFFPDSGRI